MLVICNSEGFEDFTLGCFSFKDKDGNLIVSRLLILRLIIVLAMMAFSLCFDSFTQIISLSGAVFGSIFTFILPVSTIFLTFRAYGVLSTIIRGGSIGVSLRWG